MNNSATEWNGVEKFGPVAIFLHWLIAAFLIFAVTLGLIAGDAEDSGATSTILSIHKSVGLTIFILALARLAWRLTHSPPPLPQAMPRSQRIVAMITHGALYAFLFFLPVTGYVGVAARGRETTFFGLIDVPRWVPLGRALSLNAQNLHTFGQIALYVLLAAHIGAAAYHHFILKDGLLARMWPRRT